MEGEKSHIINILEDITTLDVCDSAQKCNEGDIYTSRRESASEAFRHRIQ
ncbi:hypothetical protein J2X24_002966 [Asticcacaulis solisilvae]|nr:hypothetical protein [Asticcacaulis solisilvae]MDR6801306.1 hypothetical protein [Asticcacaulis sp. BE141]